MNNNRAKQALATRLKREMAKRGWHQSELARRADVKRDAISNYVSGKTKPSPTNLEKIAKALNTSAKELWPDYSNYIENIAEEHPPFELKTSNGSPNTAWLRVNRLVSLSTGVKIAELLEADKVAVNKATSVFD
jgi:transcriptional regulator with XRE-family HTH domain